MNKHKHLETQWTCFRESLSFNLPDTEGYWLWYQPGIMPFPCAGVVLIHKVEPGCGWSVGNDWLGMQGACKPELLRDLETLWKKIS